MTLGWMRGAGATLLTRWSFSAPVLNQLGLDDGLGNRPRVGSSSVGVWRDGAAQACSPILGAADVLWDSTGRLVAT